MLDLRREVARAVYGFIQQIADIARDTAARGSGRDRRLGSRPRWRGVKRTQRQLAALSRRIVTYVKKHPGLRIELISRNLGATTRDLILPMRKLVQAGAITTEDEMRRTRYFANVRRS